MRRLLPTVFSCLLLLSATAILAADPGEPPIVDPGSTGGHPADAIVLFDGKDLSAWKNESGNAAKWKVQDGYAEVNGTGNVLTKDEFGDVQLHIEWASPVEVRGEGQGRGNSGVYFQGRYEVQVLDSYGNKTYPDGQAVRSTRLLRPWPT